MSKHSEKSSNALTFLPDRSKPLENKRFSRRKNTLRPITFEANWEKDLSPVKNSQGSATEDSYDFGPLHSTAYTNATPRSRLASQMLSAIEESRTDKLPVISEDSDARINTTLKSNRSVRAKSPPSSKHRSNKRNSQRFKDQQNGTKENVSISNENSSKVSSLEQLNPTPTKTVSEDNEEEVRKELRLSRSSQENEPQTTSNSSIRSESFYSSQDKSLRRRRSHNPKESNTSVDQDCQVVQNAVISTGKRKARRGTRNESNTSVDQVVQDAEISTGKGEARLSARNESNTSVDQDCQVVQDGEISTGKGEARLSAKNESNTSVDCQVVQNAEISTGKKKVSLQTKKTKTSVDQDCQVVQDAEVSKWTRKSSLNGKNIDVSEGQERSVENDISLGKGKASLNPKKLNVSVGQKSRLVQDNEVHVQRGKKMDVSEGQESSVQNDISLGKGKASLNPKKKPVSVGRKSQLLQDTEAHVQKGKRKSGLNTTKKSVSIGQESHLMQDDDVSIEKTTKKMKVSVGQASVSVQNDISRGKGASQNSKKVKDSAGQKSHLMQDDDISLETTTKKMKVSDTSRGKGTSQNSKKVKDSVGKESSRQQYQHQQSTRTQKVTPGSAHNRKQSSRRPESAAVAKKKTGPLLKRVEDMFVPSKKAREVREVQRERCPSTISTSVNKGPSFAMTPHRSVVKKTVKPRQIEAAPKRPAIPPEPVEAVTVRLWSAEGEQRKSSQTTDLDIALNTFEDTAWDLRCQHENHQAAKRAIIRTAKSVISDLRTVILAAQSMRQLKMTVMRSRATLQRKREELAFVQRNHQSVRAELQGMKKKESAKRTLPS